MVNIFWQKSLVYKTLKMIINNKDGGYTGKKKLRDTSAGLKALESLCKYLGFSAKQEEESGISPKKVWLS